MLLTIAFRSIVISVKAAILNLLSVGAAYGVVVAVFQWGWGSQFLGIDQDLPIPAFVPMLMFAIVFGLSMDYEVFLLSRIREAWHQTGDAHRAVAIGIGGTARVITTAALIMVVVFSSFVIDTDPTIKMLAVGMAVAVLIDASVVRMVLVPAIMSMLGRTRGTSRAGWTGSSRTSSSRVRSRSPSRARGRSGAGERLTNSQSPASDEAAAAGPCTVG